VYRLGYLGLLNIVIFFQKKGTNMSRLIKAGASLFDADCILAVVPWNRGNDTGTGPLNYQVTFKSDPKHVIINAADGEALIRELTRGLGEGGTFIGGNAASAYANLKASGMYSELKKAGMLTENVLACEAHDKAVADRDAEPCAVAGIITKLIDQVEGGTRSYPVRGFRMPLLVPSGNYYEIALTRKTPAEAQALEDKVHADIADANATGSITYSDHPLPRWCEKHGPSNVVKHNGSYACTACDPPKWTITPIELGLNVERFLRDHSGAEPVVVPLAEADKGAADVYGFGDCGPACWRYHSTNNSRLDLEFAKPVIEQLRQWKAADVTIALLEGDVPPNRFVRFKNSALRVSYVYDTLLKQWLTPESSTYNVTTKPCPLAFTY
jgi:hypothetical protein